MPPEDVVCGSAEDWLRHARSDLAMAQLTPPPGALPEALCFHAQQAVEKALKALLVTRSVPLPRTHNIGNLLDLVSQHVAVPPHLRSAALLTEYAVAARYPGASEAVETSEREEAVRLATLAVSWVTPLVEP
jgi:HEPN domain-containing protein